MTAYDDYLANLTPEQRAALANRTQSGGAPAPSGLMSAPTNDVDYHNTPGDSQSGYVAPPSTGSKILSGLAGLSKVGDSPSAPIPAPALTGPSAAPTSLTPAYTPLGSAPQLAAIAPVPGVVANLGMPSAATPSSGPAIVPQRGNVAQSSAAPAPASSPAPLFNLDASAPTSDNSLADVSNADASNAGVSSVPNFVPAPGVADHAESLLGRIAQFAKKAGSNFVSNVSGLTDAQMATMTPDEIHRAKIAGFQGFANRLANPSVDAQGFRQSNLQALGSAIPAGTQAAQQYVGVAQQAAQQYAAMQMQKQAAVNRAAIGQLLAPADGEDVTGPQRLAKLIRAQGIAASTPGMERDAQSLAETIHWTREQQAGAVAPSLVPMDRKVGVSTQYPTGYATEWHDPKTGKVISSTPADAPAPKEAKAQSPSEQFGILNHVLTNYQAQTKKTTDIQSAMSNFQSALDNPGPYSKVAFIEAYARVMNPGASVRAAIMHIMESQGSTPDFIAKHIDGYINGQLPDSMVQSMGRLLKGAASAQYATANKKREAGIKLLHKYGIYDSDEQFETFGEPDASAQSTTTRPPPSSF